MHFYNIYFYLFFTCLSGLTIGSFLNVVIYRLPIGESIIAKRSHCPKCKSKLVWFELIPVLSWIILRRKCRYCLSFINSRYPLIEIITAITFSLSVFAEPSNLQNMPKELIIISSCILASFLIALTFIDIDYLILPNSLTSLGFISGILIASISYLYRLRSIHFTKFILNHIIAALIGLMLFLLIGYIGKIIIGKTALGIGDAKLVSMAGAWLGINGLEIVIVISFLSSGLFAFIGLITNRLTKGQQLPLGPFINVSIYLVWILGNEYWVKALGNILWWKYL